MYKKWSRKKNHETTEPQLDGVFLSLLSYQTGCAKVRLKKGRSKE